MSSLVRNVFTFSLLAGPALAAVPVMKTGDCAPFTRYTAPADDHWSQFPIQPNPLSEFPVNTIQNPLKAAQSINCIEVAQGLRAELWASEEMPGAIAYLQDFTFDERGRVWAVEPKSYPNIIRNASGSVTDQKFVGGLDRIVILEDTDGDKVMDKFKVFRDGLNMPQGIEVVNGGVVVAMVPYVAFFPNKNDTAGTPQILFSGMGATNGYDTHGGINSLRYGLDNWIYGHTGYNTCSVNGTDCGRGKMWRFRHTALGHAKTEFQVWDGGPANAHGIGQMEDGQWFQSGATLSPHINHAAVQGGNSVDIRTANGSNPNNIFYPITGDRYLWEGSTGKNAQGWFTSQTTAVSGLEFYTARLFPRKYWNRFAFSCEGANKLCNQDSLVVSGNATVTGSTWRAVRLPGPERANIFAAKDAWVAPIETRTGPDGALWVLDWYNYLFLHNPASPSGIGGAWENSLRAKSRSRIYRVAPTDGHVEPVLNLSAATVAQLVDALGNSNMLWRLQAQRLLIGKGYTAELGTMLEDILTTDHTVDAVDNNPRVVHALWTLAGMGRFDMASEAARWNPILSKLLLHPATGVRRNVLRAMPRTSASAQAISDRCSVNDGHGHVRLQALVALSEITDKPTGLKAIWATYSAIDAIAGDAVKASGIATAATQPCMPALDPVGIGPQRAFHDLPRGDIRFALVPGGLRLAPNGRLPSGEITVFDLRGQRVFSAHYDPAAAAWSPAEARLQQPMYAWDFRGIDGSRMRGTIAPGAGR